MAVDNKMSQNFLTAGKRAFFSLDKCFMPAKTHSKRDGVIISLAICLYVQTSHAMPQVIVVQPILVADLVTN